MKDNRSRRPARPAGGEPILKTARDGHYYRDPRNGSYCWKIVVHGNVTIRKAKTNRELKEKVAAAIGEINGRGTIMERVDREMISVQVWDKGNVGPVEKAIRSAGLGLNPINDGTTLRLPIPDLTEERRKELAKLAGKYAEAARIAVRNVRRDGMDALKTDEKKGVFAEDERKRHEPESPEADRRDDRRSRRGGGVEGKGNSGQVTRSVRLCSPPASGRGWGWALALHQHRRLMIATAHPQPLPVAGGEA